MRKSAETRFWISIAAPAFVLPVAAIAMFTVWYIRLQFPPRAIPSPATLAETRPVRPAQAPIEAAMTAPPEAAAEPAAAAPAEQTPEPSPAMPMLRHALAVQVHPVQTDSAAEAPTMPAEPAAEALAPQPEQQTTGIEVAAAPQSDAKTPQSAFVLPMIATLAVAPPVLRNPPQAYADPARDASPANPVMPIEPAALDPSRPIEGLVPLPRRRPHVTIVNASRTMPLPLPRPRPLENGPPQVSQR